MDKIITETGEKKLIIKTSDKIELIIDRGGFHDPSRSIELSKRQIQKLIDDLKEVII